MAFGIAALIAALLASAGISGMAGGYGADRRRSDESRRDAFMDEMRGTRTGLYDDVDLRLSDIQNAGLDLSNDDLERLYDEYDNGSFNLFDWNTWGTKHGFDLDRYNRDLDEFLAIRDQLGERPLPPDYDAIAAAADSAVDAENAQVSALYDRMLGRSNDLFESEMANGNAMYNDYANQVQANNAMATQSIAGSTRYEMDRARRNAIRRGASAAQQLTASINAQLGLQNRAAQQQLETSNQLASALLQQRQAAAQLRGDYVSNMNADASRRASMISGTAERKAGLRNSYQAEAERRYEAKDEQYKDRLAGLAGDNPYASIYNRKQGSRSSTSNYGY